MKPPNYAWILPLLHFSDSALPVGAYAHSFGLEQLCQMKRITDAESLRVFLFQDVFQSLTSVDLPLVAQSHLAAQHHNQARVHQLDQLSWAMRSSKLARESISKIGKQQLSIYHKTWGQSETPYPLTHHQSPVVMGLIFSWQQVPLDAALYSFAYQTYVTLLQSSLKLLPLGPSVTQRLLQQSIQRITSCLPEAINMSDADMGAFNPLWDIGSALHEYAEQRLFIS
jgi:urease accessory protein